MHQQGSFFPIHHVLLYFGDVVRDIVDHVHIQIIRGGAEDFGKGLRERTDMEGGPLENTGGLVHPRWGNITE